MSVFVLLDRMEGKNDKKWLVDYLCQQCEQPVVPIYSKFTLSIEYRNGLLGKLRVLCEVLSQCICLLRQSRKDDIVVCWTTLSMHVLYPLAFLFGCKRYYLAMNWITPQAGDYFNWLKRIMVKDERVKIIVNTNELINVWQELLHTDRADAFHYIPDVYDTMIPFREFVPREKHYFFTGGMSNRDWYLISRLAVKFPDVNFVCCALEDDFNEKVKNVPANMIVHFNIEASEYYRLLSEAYAVLLPLCENVVSGLINIIRSAQEGVLCLVTDIPATRQYYGEDSKDLLLSFDEAEWETRIKGLLDMSQEEMRERCMRFSSFIQEQFSPPHAVEMLVSLFPKRKD